MFKFTDVLHFILTPQSHCPHITWIWPCEGTMHDNRQEKTFNDIFQTLESSPWKISLKNTDSLALHVKLMNGPISLSLLIPDRIWGPSNGYRTFVRVRVRVTGNQFVLATSTLRPTTRIFIIFIFQLNTCGYSPYIISFLTRGWVCRLQLLLSLASAVILRSESLGIHDHIILSQIRHSPTWKVRSPYLYPTGTGWPGYTSRHWVPFFVVS
jgi:hypothetical protein